jgi:hypothetical protein
MLDSALLEEGHQRKLGGQPSFDRKRGTADASRRFATGRAEDATPIRDGQVGRRSSRSAEQPTQVGSDVPAQPEDTTDSESWMVGRWGSWRTQHRLYYKIIKIETPEAPVSGVFNLSAVLALPQPVGFQTRLSGALEFAVEVGPSYGLQAIYPRRMGSPARSAISRATFRGR